MLGTEAQVDIFPATTPREKVAFEVETFSVPLCKHDAPLSYVFVLCHIHL